MTCQCGKAFRDPDPGHRPRRKWCSRACAQRHHQRRYYAQKRAERVGAGPQERVCPNCGETFPLKNRREQAHKVFCGQACKKACWNRWARSRLRRKAAKLFAAGPQERTCPGCGKAFPLENRHQQAQKRWCSKKCYMGAYEGVRVARMRKPRFTGDGLLVGSDEWVAQMLEKMRERHDDDTRLPPLRQDIPDGQPAQQAVLRPDVQGPPR